MTPHPVSSPGDRGRGIRLLGAGRSFADTAALRSVTLAVAPGERIALVGPSGAGKTTLFRLLNFTLRPNAGVYEWNGRDASRLRGRELREARCDIATIHQQHDGVGRLGVLRNILAGRLGRWSWSEGTRAWIHPRPEQVAQASAVAARVGLEHKLFQRFDRLSGGEQQRVAIARAIFQDARVILADEPVSSLDPRRAEEILVLLLRSAEEDGRTLLVNLHQPDLARRYFPRMVGLRAGSIEFDLLSTAVDDSILAGLFAGVDESFDARAAASPDEPHSPIPAPVCRPTDVG